MRSPAASVQISGFWASNSGTRLIRRAAGGSLPNNRMTSTRPCKADRRRIIGAWLKVAVQVPLPGSAGLFSPVLCSVLVSLTFGIPLLLFLLSSLSYCLQAVASPGPVRPGLCSELSSTCSSGCRTPWGYSAFEEARSQDGVNLQGTANDLPRQLALVHGPLCLLPLPNNGS